jgi:NAD(P)-dependent dehydrogenase (short-subunit alcohol dehydrogenase family)
MGNGRALDGRIALITGGGGEIGGAIARRYAREGARVAVADLQLEKSEAVAAAIRQAGGEAVGLACDVSLESDAARAVRDAVQAFGALHVLGNVAAAVTPDGTVETLPFAEWNKAFAVNLSGPFLMCKFAVPELRKAGGGAIVNIASQLGHLGVPGRAPYCSSKAALIRLTQIIAMDHARDNIRVNSISPGAILTERSSRRYGGKEKAVKIHGPKHLLGRPGRVEEIAAAALYLASDEASFVTATDLLVDGGYTAFKTVVGADRAIVPDSAGSP